MKGERGGNMSNKMLLKILKEYIKSKKKFASEYRRFKVFIPKQYWKYYTNKRSVLGKNPPTIFLIRMAYLAGVNQIDIIKFGKLNNEYELKYIVDPKFFHLINLSKQNKTTNKGVTNDILNKIFAEKEVIRRFVDTTALKEVFASM